jgi:hypothetical protein
MTNPNGTDGTKRGAGAPVSCLRELSHDIPPPRDLWPGIAAEIAKDQQSTAGRGANRGSRLRPSGMQWAALAAVVAALAVGMWVGRNMLPLGGSQAPERVANAGGQEFLAASYVTDPRYVKPHKAMVRALEAQLKSLPPETQQQVAASLTTIRKSMSDIQAALGRDPGNALLQELLVNTYQDEMRVLTAVHEASDTGQEI